MPLDFPASPTNGQTYAGPGGVVWSWDGSKWVAMGLASGLYLPISGGTMTGAIVLSGPPAAALNPATKDYVDTADAGFLKLIGGTMTGSLVLSGPPTLALHPATKAYVDGLFPVSVASGGTGATTASTALTNLGAVAKIGDTMTGRLTITQADGTGQFVVNGTTRSFRVFTDAATASIQSVNAALNTELALACKGTPLHLQSGADINVNPVASGSLILQATGMVTGGINAVFKIGFPGGGTQYGISLRPQADNTNMMIFYNAANVSVGTISQTATTTAYNTTSDARLKEDAQDFDAGPMIDATQVYDYAWISTGEREYGVLAQEAIEVYPQAVTHTVIPASESEPGGEGWGVDYSKYVPILLQEMKAVRGRLAALEGGTPAP